MTNKQRQHLLAYHGYYVGSVDGVWGTLSKTACEAFQKDFQGITVDGYGGEETDMALKHSVAYGMPAKVTDTDVNDEFWDEIEFFDREEFRCQCGGKYCDGFPAEPHEATVRFADAIRRRLGKPVRVNSGLRCPIWNRIQGGVSNSNHMSGGAVDLGRPSGVTSAQMKEAAEEVMGSTGGIGIYDWGIHIDDGVYSRWDERT